jgi:hypothetical protein
MKSILKASLLALAAASASGAALADTFNLSGTFGTSTFFGPLNGGSFYGTYDLTNGTLGTFDIFLKDASGTVQAEINNTNGTGVFGASSTDAKYMTLAFYTRDSAGALDDVLNLRFLAPFAGVGNMVTYTGSGSDYSVGALNGYVNSNISLVASGSSVAAVPEPATWGLMGAGLLALGRLRRRTAA